MNEVNVNGLLLFTKRIPRQGGGRGMGGMCRRLVSALLPLDCHHKLIALLFLPKMGPLIAMSLTLISVYCSAFVSVSLCLTHSACLLFFAPLLSATPSASGSISLDLGARCVCYLVRDIISLFRAKRG